MLKALYDYGIRNHLTMPPGFLKRNIRAYICLSESGKFLNMEQCGKEEAQICPDIGSMANGPDKCNPLAEKVSVILEKDGKKAAYFRKLLNDGGEKIACLRICLKALEDDATFLKMQQASAQCKLKKSDRISFRVNGIPVLADPRILQWWTEYRKTLAGNSEAASTRCLITGQPTQPLATLPVISGLQVVGGHSRGEALFCFDKSAFQSYGLKQSANAPVSEEAFAVVKEAMNDLLVAAPIYAGMKFVHWYDFTLNPEDDLLFQSLQNGSDDAGDEDLLTPEEVEQERQKFAQMQRDRADEVVKAPFSGASPKKLTGEYHIVLISGNNGRAMIRRYEHGRYEMLRENLKRWTEDLKLQDSLGTGRVSAKKLNARLTRLVKKQNNSGQKLFDQMKAELAGVTPAIVMAIVNGTPLPDTVAVRALAYIRSQLLTGGGGEKKPMLPDSIACQWLKAWLIRKRRMRNEEEKLMEYYDPSFPNAAYHCGAWLAVYASLQRAAMGELNATLVQRFYASASRTPALVFGTLERMGEVYLEMLRKTNKRLVPVYEKRLNNVCTFFGAEPERQLPTTLNLEGQSYFALGYRQMCTQIIGEINKATAESREGQ